MTSIICVRPLLQLNLLFAFLILLSFSVTGLAQNRHVYDYAKVYQPELTTQYDSLLQDIEEKSGVRIDAAILAQFSAEQPQNEVIAYLQQQMINKEPVLNNDILLVVSINDNFVAILPSQDLEKFYPENIKIEIIDKIKQDIQSGNYNQILKSGLGGIIHYYNQGEQTSKETEKSTPMTLLRNNLLLVVLGLLIFAAFRYARRKPPRKI